MVSRLTDQEIIQEYHRKKDILEVRLRRVANAAAQRQKEDLFATHLQDSMVKELTQLWVDVLGRDRVVDRMAGLLTDVLRLYDSDPSIVQQIKRRLYAQKIIDPGRNSAIS